MNRKAALLLALTAVVILVACSGCSSKGTGNTANQAQGNNVNTELQNNKPDQSVTENQPAVTENADHQANVVNQVQKDSQIESIYSSEPRLFGYFDSELNYSVEELKNAEPHIDPDLANLKIKSNDPDIKVIRLDLVDNRDYEKSKNWEVHALLSNDGSQPVYMNADLQSGTYAFRDPDFYYTLDSGERIWINLSAANEENGFTMDNLPYLKITSYKTIFPDVSPEFSNFDKKRVTTYRNPYIEIHSIKYVVKDENKGWKSILLEVSNDAKSESSVCDLHFVGSDGLGVVNNGYYLDDTMENIVPGKTKQIELPLKSISPEQIYGIKIA